MHGGGDFFRFERVLDARALGAAHGVLRENAGPVALHLDRAKSAEQLVVAPRQRNAALELPPEAPELGQHDSALQRVHAAADADPRVLVAAALSVMADFAHRLGERVIAREKRAAVAIAAKRLRWEKAAGADRREIAAAPALVQGAEALRRVLDYRQAMARRNGVDLIHVGGLAVERHRHDGARL